MPKEFVLDKSELYLSALNRRPSTNLIIIVRELKTKNPSNAKDADFKMVYRVGPNQPYTELSIGSNKQKIEGTELQLLAEHLLHLNLWVNYEGFCYFPTRGRVDSSATRLIPFYRINELFDWATFVENIPKTPKSTWNRCQLGRNETVVDYVQMKKDLEDYKNVVDLKNKRIARLEERLQQCNSRPPPPPPPPPPKDPDAEYRDIINRSRVALPSNHIHVRTNQKGYWPSYYETILEEETLVPENTKLGGQYAIHYVRIASPNVSDFDTNNWWFIKVKQYKNPIAFYAGDFGGYENLGYSFTSTPLPFSPFEDLFAFGTTPNFICRPAVLLGFGPTVFIGIAT